MDSKPLSLNERLMQSLSNSRLPVSESEENPQKMKPRRRLCKTSSASEEPVDQIEPPSFDFDFDSDPEKSPQIRDILNSLTAKLDSLSIQKKEVPPSKSSLVGGPELPFDLDELSSDSATQEKSTNTENLNLEDEECVVLSGKGLGKTRADSVSGRVLEDPVQRNEGSVEIWEESDGDAIMLIGEGSKYVLPGKIAKTLFPHQRDGLRWLWSLHCMQTGGILGDDMGLGKTMQVAAFLAGLFHSSLIRRALIVAPKTLLPHWIKELAVVGLSDKTKEYFAPCLKTRQYELNYILKDKGVLVTTYDIVRNNFKALRGDSYFDENENEYGATWDYVILDEGHIIKNPSTQRAQSLLEIPSIHRVIISGTPIQNNLKELWALFNFCCPDLLGDKKEFKARYESAILRGNDKSASARDKSVGSTVAKELRERIKPYFLRRLKNEVSLKTEATDSAELPKKHELIVWLKLSRCQRQLYEAFLKSELVLSSFNGSPLAAITILKKICVHPLLLTKKAAEGVLEGMDSILDENDIGMAEDMAYKIAKMTALEDSVQEHENASCKLTFIMALLDNLVPEGHNVLIFSQTRKMLNLIQESIVMEGYTFLRIDGTTKISERQKIVNDFQTGTGAPILLLTSQVGGLGLTLTNADRVIVVDPAWNPSTDNQSVDRAYRIGQKKDVVVYRLMTCGTIEEKIYKMQVFKGALFRTATEQKEQTRYFSQKDLQELFSLPAQGFDISLTQQQLQEEHGSQHHMDDLLKDHIKFLESQGISGVSHHSMLFSKSTPVTLVEEEESTKISRNLIVGKSSSSGFPLEHNVDGADFAFIPKHEYWRKKEAPKSQPREEEIRKKIERLSQTLSNKAVVSNLSDKGERIRKQILELNLELDNIKKSESKEKDIIDIDDIVEHLGRL